MNEFIALGLGEHIASGLSALGFERPTKIQGEAIPRLLAGENLMLRSDTGTGKTFAYLAAALSRKEGSKGAKPSCVVVPTQELAVQVAKEAKRLAEAAGVQANVVLAIGGSLMSRQAKAIKAGADVVVGTCARMLDLATTGSLPFDRCDAAIFDEIDRLMAKETREQLERLVSMAPGDSLKVFVSATIGERTREWIEARCPDAVLCDPGAEGILNDAIEHWAFFEEGRKKVQFLRSFLAAANPDRCLVFFSRSEQAAEAAEKLAHHGLAAAALHSKADQDARKAAIQAFKEGKVKILVTSDLAARGLDFPGVTHVISADLPDDADIYVHRAGRTGRAGALGFSIIAADLVELQRASRIAVKKKFSFHCMELAGGRMRDKDPEAFFVEAEATEVERQMRERERRAFGRVDRGAPGRERPPSGDGSRPRARETGRASAYDTRERPRTARAPSSAAGDTQGPKARDARGRPPVRGPLSADRSSPAGGPPRARGARDHGGPERPRQPRAEGGPPRKHDALPPSKRKGKRRDGRNGE